MVDFNDYGFSEKPFPITPDYRVTNWAGRAEVRRILNDIVESALTNDTGLSEFVIVHGSFGAGKTHALRYFATLINEVAIDRFQAKAIYVPKLKKKKKISFLSLYFQIIQDLGIEFLKDLSVAIKERIKTAADQLGSQLERDEERTLLDEDPEVFRKRVINSISKEDRPMIQLLYDFEGEQNNIGKYLTEGKPIISGSDFSQQINTDYMAIRVLASLFRAMTMTIGDQEPIYHAIHLFLDEVEEIMESKAGEQVAFWQSVRELVNRLPYNFVLLLSFTADTALLEAIIPEALLDRTSRQNVELQSLEIAEAKEFIRNHLEDFRPEGYSPSQPFAPFTEEAIDYILEQTVVLVPRKIFRALRTVLERAIRREGLEPGEEIDAAMTEEIIVSMGI